VVLSLVLEDRGLMAEGVELLERTGTRADAFVISTGAEGSEAALPRVMAALRGAGLHARRTHRTTRNVGKLLKEASQVGARTAVIIGDEGETANVKRLDSQEERGVAIDRVAEEVVRAREVRSAR
jgi:histidyl-tRNA synthetase